MNEKISGAQLKLADVSATLKNATEIETVEKEITQLCKEKQELEHKLAAHANEIDFEALAAKQQEAKVSVFCHFFRLNKIS